MDYIIVCPTHRRPHTFYKKTYHFLQRSAAIKPVLWVNDERDLKELKWVSPEDLEKHFTTSFSPVLKEYIMNLK